MAEIILAILCILIGVGSTLLALLALWAGALERSATGSSDTKAALWLGLTSLAGYAGATFIIVT